MYHRLIADEQVRLFSLLSNFTAIMYRGEKAAREKSERFSRRLRLGKKDLLFFLISLLLVPSYIFSSSPECFSHRLLLRLAILKK